MLIKNKILIFLTVLMFTISGFFFYLIYQNSKIKTEKTYKKEGEAKEYNYPADLKGKIYLTLKEKEAFNLRENKNNYGIYTFDLETGYFGEKYLLQDCPILGGELDSEGNKMLISGRCNDDLNEQIYTIHGDKELQKITNTAGKFKKEAVWSNDNQKIAFMSSLDGLEEIPTFDINSWDIKVSDLEGRTEKISNGVHPFFSPDGEKILFLKENGLNLVDVKTKVEKNVFNFDADVTFHLDLSLNRDRLVISDPLNRNIVIFKINSWDNFQLEEIYKIKTPETYISWPKFSPYDNQYLVYEEWFPSGLIDLVVYDLNKSKRHIAEDLSFYEHGFMWINDWR